MKCEEERWKMKDDESEQTTEIRQKKKKKKRERESLYSFWSSVIVHLWRLLSNSWDDLLFSSSILPLSPFVIAYFCGLVFENGRKCDNCPPFGVTFHSNPFLPPFYVRKGLLYQSSSTSNPSFLSLPFFLLLPFACHHFIPCRFSPLLISLFNSLHSLR